jgi:hypothetical protein
LDTKKVDLAQINREHFNVYEKNVGDEICYLVLAKPGAVWTKENLIFRSSVWNKDGYLISASYKKFFNWSEQPNIDPIPFTSDHLRMMEKIDGSTLIISKYKNNLIIRTRGSVDTTTLVNHHEIDMFKSKYPKVFDFNCYCGENFSYIYEWVSPENRIILNYSEPKLILTGIINNCYYSMLSQHILDNIASQLNVERPKQYYFNTLDEMSTAVKDFKGVEGICVYYNNGQSIRKVKSAEYLMLHKLRFDLSIENVLDLYLKYEQPDYYTFIKKVTEEFDFEALEFIIPFISRIKDASKEVKGIIDHMNYFVNKCRVKSRKEAAEVIIAAYGKTSRSSFVFNIYDNKPLSNDAMKKLFLQVL